MKFISSKTPKNEDTDFSQQHHDTFVPLDVTITTHFITKTTEAPKMTYFIIAYSTLFTSVYDLLPTIITYLKIFSFYALKLLLTLDAVVDIGCCCAEHPALLFTC